MRRFTRRNWYRLMLASVLPGAWWAAAPAAAGTSSDGVADLRDQLRFGLRARLPQEQAFVNRVVDKVEAGQLPVKLVMALFQWARRKRPYPFPYFERAMRIRAEELGVAL